MTEFQKNLTPTVTDIWCEFEHWSDPYDPAHEAANVCVTLEDGRKYTLNVWTYGLLERDLKEHSNRSGSKTVEYSECPADVLIDTMERDSVEKMVRELFVPGFEAALRSDSFGISYREPWIDLSDLSQDSVLALPVPPLHHPQPVEYLEGLLHECGDRQGVPTRSDAVVEIGADHFRLEAHLEAANLSDGEIFCWIPGPQWLTVRMVLDSRRICIRFDRSELYSSQFDFWFRRIRPSRSPA